MTAAPVKYGEHLKVPPGASCDTCGSTDKRIITEHCHAHGWVRGLACGTCNHLMSVIDRRIAPKAEAVLLNALIALWRRCPDCSNGDALELGPAPQGEPTARYVLMWPHSMAEKVAAAAKSQTMPMSVWVREAIREKLEREAAGS